MTKKLLILAFVLYGSMTHSQEKSYTFSLEEAIAFALDSSYTALNARRDVAIALKQKWETTASGLPQISASIAYNNNLKQPVTLIPGEFSGGEPGTFVPVTFGTKQNANAVATLQQLIFDGSYLVGLQAAKTFLEYTENANQKTRLEIRKGVINAYGSVLMAKELVAIFTNNKETLEKNLSDTRVIFENGLAEEEDVEQLEITYLDITTYLDNAERTLEIAKQMFNISLGLDVHTEVTLTQDLDELTRENMQLDMLNSDFNLEQNVDYKIAYNLTEQRELELKLEKSRALPSLSGFVNYGTQANSNTFTFLDGDQRWFQSSILGFQLNIPVFSSGMRGARTQQARIALEQAETQFTQAKQQLTLAYDQAKSNYTFLIDKYSNAKKNLSLAERIESKNQLKFTEGIASSFDLRQAQLQLYTAQESYFQSMVDVINAKAELETILNNPE